MTAYDAIVIGTGQAGPYVTSRLAGAGMKVAVIERSAFGGTCAICCSRNETSRAVATVPNIIGTLGALRSRLPINRMRNALGGGGK